jgi:hypothetical protein
MYEKGVWGLGSLIYKISIFALLGSLVRRYITDEHKHWRDIIYMKYCRNKSISYTDKRQASPFWKGVILAAQALKFGYR